MVAILLSPADLDGRAHFGLGAGKSIGLVRVLDQRGFDEFRQAALLDLCAEDLLRGRSEVVHILCQLEEVFVAEIAVDPGETKPFGGRCRDRSRQRCTYLRLASGEARADRGCNGRGRGIG
jgi:hypothetical protein